MSPNPEAQRYAAGELRIRGTRQRQTVYWTCNTLDYAKQVTAEHRGRVTPWIAKFRGVHIFSNVLARVHILNRILLDVGIVGTLLLAPGMDTHG